MRKTLIAGLAVVLLLAVGCGSNGSGGTNGASGSQETTVQEAGSPEMTGAEDTNLPDRVATGKIPQPRLETRTVVLEGSGGDVQVEAEIADDNSERARGLMARKELGENEGMLFVFPSEQSPGFYMKNTLIPLSIAYIDAEGRIVDIQDMQPLDETPHPPAEPAQYALEVNQGFFEEQGVEVGDNVELPDSVTGG